jgi:hypothetical protein
MEICWLYAWVTFLSLVVTQRPYPLREAAATIIVGAFVARFMEGKGFRIVLVLLVHAIIFASLSLWTVYTMHFPGSVFVGSGWARDLTGGPRGFVEWAGVVLTFFWVLMFWISGIALAKRPKTYYAFCARFDIGLAAFFCLFLVRLVMFVKGGIRTEDSMAQILTITFLLCALFAIGMTRVQSGSLKSFLPGYRRVSIIVGYASTLVFVVSGLVLLSMPWLSSWAGDTDRTVKGAAVSSLPMVEKLLRIVFSRGDIRPKGAASSSSGSAWNFVMWARGSWWMEYLERLLGWGLWGIFCILSLCVLGFVVFVTVRWLFSRTRVERPDRESPNPFLVWLSCIRDLLRSLAGSVKRIARGYHRARDIYGGFLRWAHRSGMSPLNGETPAEFGNRLSKYIPPLSPEIDVIVSTYNREVYGEMDFAGDGPAILRHAWRTVRSPLYWPLRLKTRFMGVEDDV